ncbi:hypothetical protein C6499_22810 [Candidatus Poribacteria bacterium]|nr:MAG: hypothetical protein C6499_22810 [Candidatus Poribacteria bacterium]
MIDLQKKTTRAEYEANKEAIAAAVAAQDAAFIRQELGMTNWTAFHRDGRGIIAECKFPTQAMWKLWRRDRIQIDKRSLQITKDESGNWIVHCYDNELSELLIND